jgi:hypothetical protein
LLFGTQLGIPTLANPPSPKSQFRTLIRAQLHFTDRGSAPVAFRGTQSRQCGRESEAGERCREGCSFASEHKVSPTARTTLCSDVHCTPRCHPDYGLKRCSWERNLPENHNLPVANTELDHNIMAVTLSTLNLDGAGVGIGEIAHRFLSADGSISSFQLVSSCSQTDLGGVISTKPSCQ